MSNPTEAHVLFKVKTNAAKRYGVKPHIGVLVPREQRAISGACTFTCICRATSGRGALKGHGDGLQREGQGGAAPALRWQRHD
jgi:hypothetical protein